jgi:REP element-mobilizing transposase RayT
MSYTSGRHTVFHHRYHIVWTTKYRYKVLEGRCGSGNEQLSGRYAKNWASRGAFPSNGAAIVHGMYSGCVSS